MFTTFEPFVKMRALGLFIPSMFSVALILKSDLGQLAKQSVSIVLKSALKESAHEKDEISSALTFYTTPDY